MYINFLQTFGKIPNYLHHQQLQSEASQKETETNQFKPKGHYITGPEREALLKVTTYFSAIFNVSGDDYSHILYIPTKQDWYDRKCKLVRTYYFNNLRFICLNMFGLLYLGSGQSNENTFCML